MSYVLGDFEREHERLKRIGAIHDPVTFRHLSEIGVNAGWRCAEVGGGGGNVAEWLSERVGADGHVVATDVDTRFLDSLSLANLEVRQHDICADSLGDGLFDLIHTRLVLMHVRDRESALTHLVDAVRPGGWLLVEEPDFATMRESRPRNVVVETAMDAVLSAFDRAGADWRYGLAVPTGLRARGVQDISAEGELTVMQFGGQAIEALALLLENVGPRLTSADLISKAGLEEAIEAVRRPSIDVICSPLIVSTRGRRPL
jgi:SAM-dependent methyltransferase